MPKFILQRYEIHAPKLSGRLRLAQVSDLHSCLFGPKQRELVRAAAEAEPDFLVMTGDLADDERPIENAVTFAREAAKIMPCFYVTGNHEIRRSDLGPFLSELRRCGVRILSGDLVRVPVRGQEIQLAGTEDPTAVPDFAGHLAQTFRGADRSAYTILLSHKPEYIDEFLRFPCDLILSGHAHGGQWRIPRLMNGLYAPGQGLFPKYAGGRYDHGGVTHIVSRGLDGARHLLPRLYNPRELVIADLLPGA